MKQNSVRYIPLGEVVSVYDKKNTDGMNLPVYGINKDNDFMPTVANLNDVDTSKYKLLKKGVFAFNGMHVGRDVAVPIGKFDEDFDALISPAYTTFTIKNCEEVIDDYLEIIFRLDEFDRNAWFYCDSSIRGGIDWKRLCEILIPLPSPDKQREIVNVWKSLKRLKEQNEKISEPLMALCRSKLKELRDTMPLTALDDYIEQSDQRNYDGYYGESDVRGLATSKEMIATKANLEGVSLTSYKLFKPQEFAYVPDTSRRGDKVSMAFNGTKNIHIVSSISCVFRVKPNKELIPDYLFMFFLRPEFDRYARFNSWGSARETFTWEEMKRVKIPIPSKEVQQAIVDIYQCAQRAKTIAAEADKQLKSICPALIQYVANN